MQDVSGQAKGFTSSIKESFSRIGEFAAAIGLERLFEKIGDGMKEAIKTGIDYNANLEQSTVAWTTLLGTQDKAKQMMKDIQKFAAATPFETADVDAMAKQLNNAGLSGKAMFDQLMKVSDVASAFAIPIDSAKEMVRQVSQVQQAGVAYTEDINILQDRGIPIYKSLADQLHTTTANVKKMASEGKITADVYMTAFNNVANTVKGASDKQSQTFNGMLSTLSDNLKIITGTLMQKPFEYLKTQMDKVMPIIQQFSTTLQDKGLKTAISEIVGKEQTDKLFSMFDKIKTQGVEAFNLFKKGIQFVIDNFNTLEPIMGVVIATIAGFKVAETIIKIYETWMAITKLMAAAQLALNLVLMANPIGLVILAIGALVAAGVYMYQNWSGFRDGMNRIWSSIEQDAASMVNGIVDKIDWLIDKINAVGNLVGVTIPKISHVDWGAQSGSGGGGSVGDLPSVAHYATGTDFHPGGLAILGEQGSELVDLPRGSKVYTSSETKQMLNGGNKGNTYNVTVNTLKADMNEKDLVRALQRMEALNT